MLTCINLSKLHKAITLFLTIVFCFSAEKTFAQKSKVLLVAENGWAKNTVNTVVFRKNSLASYKDVQYIAFYDDNQFLVLGKRKFKSPVWQLHQTPYKGDATDAHKSVSIMVDGDGYLHVAWNQHNNALHYAIAKSPGSLELSAILPMLGKNDQKVTYPEFYRLSNGDLFFFYRDGGSGNGNLVMNRYHLKAKRWERIQSNLIDGEGLRNAYWQLAVDQKDNIHISWVWRESPNVASNHDVCYAVSKDGGVTWQKSTQENYQLPINAKQAEYIAKVPQNSSLINQTSMCVSAKGEVFIATYWQGADERKPRYKIIDNVNGGWKTTSLDVHQSDFSLGGQGTKKIPISRPQIITWTKNNTTHIGLVFRDNAQGSKIMLAQAGVHELDKWKTTALSNKSYGDWEPTFDTLRWQRENVLDLFAQHTEQVDGEGLADSKTSAVEIVEWKP